MPDTTLTSAVNELKTHQTQLDMDGVMVGVSRQALDIVLEALARAGLEAGKAEESMRERAALACEAQKQGFLSPQYASNQPLGSMLERFACDECADAIRALPLTGGDKP